MKKNKKCLIFAGGKSLLSKEEIQYLFQLFEGEIACLDSGYDYIFERGIDPKYIFGDFDSTRYKKEIINNKNSFYKKNQDLTDFDFAIEILKTFEYNEFYLYSERLGRLDHFYSNIQRIKFKDEFVFMFGKYFEIIKIKDYFQFDFKPKDVLSFFSTGGIVSPIKTYGLRWDFDYLAKDFMSSSNEAIGGKVKIEIGDKNSKGILLIRDYYESDQNMNLEEKIINFIVNK